MIDTNHYTIQHIELEVADLDIDDNLKDVILETLDRYNKIDDALKVANKTNGNLFNKLSELQNKLAEIEKKAAIGYIYTQGLRDLNNIGSATIYKEQQKFILSAPQRETTIYTSSAQQSPVRPNAN